MSASAVGEISKNPGLTFTWYIEEFPLWFRQKDTIIHSPVVRVEQLKNTDWMLTIPVPDANEDDIALILERCADKFPGTPSRLYVEGKLFIAKNDGTRIFSNKFRTYFQVQLSSEKLVISRKVLFAKDSNMFFRMGTLTVGFQFFTNSSIPIECIGRVKFNWKEYSIHLPLVFPEIADGSRQQTIMSPVISTSREHARFRIYMNCNDFNSEVPIRIQIQMSEFALGGLARYKFFMFSKEVLKMKYQSYFEIQRNGQIGIVGINVSKDTFHKHSLFEADRLQCELRVMNGEYEELLEKTIYGKNVCFSSMDYLDTSFQSCMEKFVNNTLCDFKVIVSGREFFTHKAILAAVSPVFSDIFKSCIIESERSQVTFEDFSIRTVEKMFEFVYSGTVRDITWDDALELYSIADKYQIKRLRFACYSFLKSALRVERVPELLIFIYPYDDAYLHKVVDAFIRVNSNAVFQLEIWKNFMKNNVQIACDTMYRICQSVL